MSQLLSNLVLGADVSGLVKGLSDAANASNLAGQEIKASTEQMASSTDKAEVATKGLMQAHRAAAKEAQILAQNTGEFSAETIKATKHAAELGHSLEEWKKAESTYKPGGAAMLMGNSLATAAKAAGGVAAGMALIGVEDDKVLKTMMQLQSVMMMVEGIKAVGEMKEAYLGMSVVMKAQVIPAIASMGTAMLLSGVGAIVLVVAALAALSMEMSKNEAHAKALEQADKDLAESLKALDEATNKATESNIKSRQLEIKAMADGHDKKMAMIALEKTEADLQAKAAFQKSTASIYDQQRYFDALLNNKKIYLKESEKLDQEEVVGGIERKKAYQEAFANWSNAEQMNLLQNELKVYDKGSEAYKNKVNEIKILSKEMQNSQQLAFEMNIGYSKTEGVSDAIGKELSKGFSKPKEYKLPITFKAIGNPIGPILKQTKVELTALQKELSDDISSATSGMSSAIGQAMASGNDVAKAAGDSLLKALGDIAVRKGEFYIALGAAEAVALDPMSIAHLAGGAALVLAGSAIGAMGSGGGSTSSSGSGNNTAAQSTGWNGAGGNAAQTGTNFGTLNATTQISGRNLQIVLNRNNYITGRVK